MTTERTPMEELRSWLHYHRNTTNLSDARVRAQMLKAMIDGADKAEVETLARALGFHLEPKEETNE